MAQGAVKKANKAVVKKSVTPSLQKPLAVTKFQYQCCPDKMLT
jgi:hypothetical protein